MFAINYFDTRTFALVTALSATCSAFAADRPDISPKEQMHLDMIALAQQMHDLRPQMASDESAAALYQQLHNDYQRMSDELGGDDPGRAILSGTADADAAGAAMRPTSPPDEGGIAGSSATPPGCGSDTGLFGNSADFPIPDLGTVTSTIFVNGPAGRLWYVQPTLFIQHTFNADLDITLTSPSGTTVTISTDNGGSNDNVFSNTVFADDVNPGGQVPYTTNNGLVTDHLYQNGVTATALVAEEPMHRFAGEDPNGTWTLRISDDASLNTGTLLGWNLFVQVTGTPTNRTTRTFTNSITGVILNGGTLVRNVPVSGMGGFLCDVQVRLDVSHGWCEDLDISLTSPSGRVITLTTDNGSVFEDVFAGTTFDDAVDPGSPGVHTATDGPYVNMLARNVLTPEESFGSLRGTSANGTWSLRVSDDEVVPGGDFNSVSLILTTCSCEPACTADVNGDGAINADDVVGVILGWGACP
jgi:subtilisin-like proprotein convertase family protein